MLEQHITMARTAAATIEHPWDVRALDWPLTPASVVVEVGGYTGRWALQIAERYNPRLYVFEPQAWAADVCRAVLEPYNAQVFTYALGVTSGTAHMGNWGTDGCSLVKLGDEYPCDMGEIGRVFQHLDLAAIDLLLMNIEGYEYTLLPYMLDRGVLPQRLMVQWHTHAASAAAHDALIARLGEHYQLLWAYTTTLMAWEAR